MASANKNPLKRSSTSGADSLKRCTTNRGPKKGNPDHDQRVIVALNEIIRLMKEIDEIIEAHGVWSDVSVAETGSNRSSD